VLAPGQEELSGGKSAIIKAEFGHWINFASIWHQLLQFKEGNRDVDSIMA
jgi:hypothetical protein